MSILKFKILTAVLIITLVIGCENTSDSQDPITASSLYYMLDNVQIEDGILEDINLGNYYNFKKNCGKNRDSGGSYYYSKEINISGNEICIDHYIAYYDVGYNPDYYSDNTYCGKICYDVVCDEIMLIERIKKLKEFLENEIKTHNEKVNKNCDARYADMKKLAQVFLKDELDKAVNIAENSQNKNKWLYQIHNYPEFAKATAVLYTKYYDIAERELTLRNKKDELLKKYGKDFSTTNIDNDIKHLNNLAWKLREPTKRFFPIAKKYMMKIDEANTRAEAMHGLKTFTQEIEIAGNQPSEALEKSVADIEVAINNLDKELNK